MNNQTLAIELGSISKEYGKTTVLNDISLTIRPGEFVVILGESGCGKSTLLKIIAGLDAATRGTVRIGSRVMDNVAPKDRGLAMVFQSYALYPHLNVWENIAFPLKMKQWRYVYSLPFIGKLFPARKRLLKTMRDAAAVAAEKVRLTPLLDRKPSELSGGQRQRVALARAIVDGRDICLMDEPLSNLDTQLRASTRREIAELHNELGHTVVYVTHDQTEAMTMGSRVILMRGGRIEQDGTPADLYERPATIYAAEFLGTPKINLLRVANTRFAQAEGDDIVFGTGGLACDADGDLTLGVRPEHVTMVPDPGGEFVFQASEYLGGRTIVSFKGPDDTLVQTFATSAMDPEQRYGVRFERRHVMQFDSKTGRRL